MLLRLMILVCVPWAILATCPNRSDRLKNGVFCKIWDEDDCTGWEFEAGEGYHEFSSLGGKSDDAEAVAVAPGCMMTLYDEDDDDVDKRGERMVVDNRSGNQLLVERDLGDLDEDVEAFDCVCPRRGGSNRRNGANRGTKCPSPNDRLKTGVFCKIWDEDDCTGWEYEAGEGYHEFSSLGGKSDDAEAVAVAPGCMMTLYDEDDDDVDKRGERIVVDNRRGNQLLIERDLGDLDEDVEAFDCNCPRRGSGGAIRGGNDAESNARGACRNIRFPNNVDCIVFDGENCSLDSWDEARMYMGSGRSSSSASGIISSILGGSGSSSANSNLKTEESFSLLKSFSNRKYKNAIKSVAVRKGAELIVFDHSDFTNDAYSFRADGNSDIFVNLADHPDPAVRSLNKDIESLQCKKLGFTGK